MSATDDAAGPYRLEEQVGFLIRKAHQRASGIFNAVMGEFDVTPTQFAALAKLDDVGTVPQSELGRMTAMDPATIFGVVQRLAKRGYLRSADDPGDARQVLLTLTEDGRAAVRAMKARGFAVSSRTLAPLSQEERETVVRLLQKLG